MASNMLPESITTNTLSNVTAPPIFLRSSGRRTPTAKARRSVPSQPSHQYSIPTALHSRRQATAGLGDGVIARSNAGPTSSGHDRFDADPSGIPEGFFGSNGYTTKPITHRRLIRRKSSPRYYLGIETEFLLQGRHSITRQNNIVDFLSTLASVHNKNVKRPYPQMDAKGEDDDIWMGQSDCSWWIVMEEGKLLSGEEMRSADIWGVEMKTPKMLVSGDEDWENWVKTTWAFIQKNYMIRRNEMCSTHVHISILRGVQPGTQINIGMGLINMKKIAQCAIHWETALEVLVPEERRRNIHATSNWIDNINFQDEKITRRIAIQMIEKCNSEKELIELMSPQPQERYFTWNFRALTQHGTIEFRKGGASVTANEALAWAEFTLLFVQAAVQTTPETLQPIPSNIKELKTFLGEDKLIYLRPLFNKKRGNDSLQTVPLLYQTIERAFTLEKKIRADEEEQRKLKERRQS